MTTRFFLVAPEAVAENLLLQCAGAACAAGDCATIVVPPTLSQETVSALQALNLAVILNDAEPRKVHHLKADGLQLSSIENFVEARKALPHEALGFFAGVSRHAAMEAAEAGADYVAFSQTKQYTGEPIIAWWQEVTDLPAVAIDPVTPPMLTILLPQKPDFLRPSTEMWQDASMATTIIAALAAGLNK